MPIIEGGTYRVWSRSQDLQLSAEQSYDPNMEPDNQSLLHYHWGCQSTSKVRLDCETLQCQKKACICVIEFINLSSYSIPNVFMFKLREICYFIQGVFLFVSGLYLQG